MRHVRLSLVTRSLPICCAEPADMLCARSHRIVRLFTWLPVAMAYAALYLGRYNLAAINVPAVRDLIGLSALQLGTVSAMGMWSYALTAPATGFWLRPSAHGAL